MASLIYRCSLPLYFLGFAPSSASLSVALISIRVNLIIFIVLTLLTELLGSKSPPAISRETAGHPPAVVHLRSTQGEADPEEKRLQPSVCCAETPLQLSCEAGGDLRANLGALEASPGTPRELEDGSKHQLPAPRSSQSPIFVLLSHHIARLWCWRVLSFSCPGGNELLIAVSKGMEDLGASGICPSIACRGIWQHGAVLSGEREAQRAACSPREGQLPFRFAHTSRKLESGVFREIYFQLQVKAET